jgi:hypothetical protein
MAPMCVLCVSCFRKVESPASGITTQQLRPPSHKARNIGQMREIPTMLSVGTAGGAHQSGLKEDSGQHKGQLLSSDMSLLGGTAGGNHQESGDKHTAVDLNPFLRMHTALEVAAGKAHAGIVAEKGALAAEEGTSTSSTVQSFTIGHSKLMEGVTDGVQPGETHAQLTVKSEQNSERLEHFHQGCPSTIDGTVWVTPGHWRKSQPDKSDGTVQLTPEHLRQSLPNTSDGIVQVTPDAERPAKVQQGTSVNASNMTQSIAQESIQQRPDLSLRGRHSLWPQWIMHKTRPRHPDLLSSHAHLSQYTS